MSVHYLLFHLYLAPWMALGGMAGAKLATAVVAAGVGVAAWVMLRGVGVRFPTVWAAMLFGLSSPFLYQLLMVRTQGASRLLILALHVLFQKRHRLLLPLGFAYAWL